MGLDTLEHAYHISDVQITIAESLGLPVEYVGMGETADDLDVFDAEDFVNALFADWQSGEEIEPG